MLAGCISGVARPTQNQRLLQESDACKLIGTPPKLPTPNRARFFVVGVKASLIAALSKSDNAQLQDVGGELSAATRNESRSGNGAPVVRALDKGVEVCRRLGFSTTR